ncbi:3'-5' exonuclease [Roseibium sp.]|uniref:3'-5' exonuclease n=1 Tax=Roseibium sp. TaxID=1936156 RepID=UPI00261E2042|nr:3'-5' exonuclease [Roseibium sp.]
MSISLRMRIFLTFFSAAVASSTLVAVALYIGFLRAAEEGHAAGFLFAGVLSFFGLLAVSTGVWRFFDEYVARPIEHIASNVRACAHADVKSSIDMHKARFLGDLAPAVHAVTGHLSKVSDGADQIVAAETSRLMAEKAHLALLLTEIPVAIILVSPTNQIMLYDGQAADVLGQVHVPRLSASIFDYFNEIDLRSGLDQLSENRTEVVLEVRGSGGRLSFELRLKKLHKTPGYMILVDDTHARIAPEAARPLIFDFDLSEHETEHAIENRPIKGLNFVVFDTETTGLMPNKDEIVQVGAVRVVKGRIVPGESVNQLANPGRSIPRASTKVHGITDSMVAGAPDVSAVVSGLHAFARESVLVAHNAPFDMAFLHRHEKTSGLIWDHPLLDTVLLSAVLFGDTEVHTLDALCERLDIRIDPDLRHTALGDAQATAEALCKMLPILEGKGFETFGDVIQETRKHGRLLKDLN